MSTADSRRALLNMKFEKERIDADGNMNIDFSDLATEYYVRCVPGSLVEMEDEKQLRVLNQLFVPLSQAMPALAASQDQQMIHNFAAAMAFIVEKQIELSGSNRSNDLKNIVRTGEPMAMTEGNDEAEEYFDQMDVAMNGMAAMAVQMQSMQEQMRLLTESQAAILSGLGADNAQSKDIPEDKRPALERIK